MNTLDAFHTSALQRAIHYGRLKSGARSFHKTKPNLSNQLRSHLLTEIDKIIGFYISTGHGLAIEDMPGSSRLIGARAAEDFSRSTRRHGRFDKS